MELEFDKEIDAILRKARSGDTVALNAAPHLDADTIAAFAENALPDKAKLLYVEHFADCDYCRKQLSFVIQMNKEPVRAAAAPVLEPVIEASIPWYQTFFKVPNLAVAMGALVIVFSGVLGYLVMQKPNASDSTLSQVKEPEQTRGGPNFNTDAASNTAPLEDLVATANPTPPSANMAANSAAVAPGESSGLPGRDNSEAGKADAARGAGFQIDGASGSENSFINDGQEVTDARPPARSAGEPAVRSPANDTNTSINSQSAELLPKGGNMSSVLDATTGAASERDEKKQNKAVKLKEESKDLELAKQRRADDRGFRDMPRAASKVGPSRGVGPVQNQSNQIYNKNYDMPVTRVVGGKTFNNREGAWYDSAYHGQASANFRRGTAEYKKLDSGLRNIADTVGGTVVLMWKGKAYRIQ